MLRDAKIGGVEPILDLDNREDRSIVMTHWTQVFFVAICCACLQACVPSCEELAPPLKIGTNVWPGYEPLYFARQQKILDSDRFSLVEFGSATENIRSFRSGLVDFAALTLDETLLLAHDGIDVKILLVMDISEGGDVVIARPDIDQLSSLRGKRIGFEDTALGGYMLNRLLQKAGLSREDIVPIYMEVDRHEKAYQQQELDAVITFEPVSSKLQATGQKVIFSSADIPAEVIDVLVVRGDVLRSHPDSVAALTDAWFRSLQAIDSDPKAAHAFMADREQLAPEDFAKALAGIRIPTRAESARMLSEPDAGVAAAIEKISRFMWESGRFKRSFEAREVLLDAPAYQRLH